MANFRAKRCDLVCVSANLAVQVFTANLRHAKLCLGDIALVSQCQQFPVFAPNQAARFREFPSEVLNSQFQARNARLQGGYGGTPLIRYFVQTAMRAFELEELILSILQSSGGVVMGFGTSHELGLRLVRGTLGIAQLFIERAHSCPGGCEVLLKSGDLDSPSPELRLGLSDGAGQALGILLHAALRDGKFGAQL